MITPRNVSICFLVYSVAFCFFFSLPDLELHGDGKVAYIPRADTVPHTERGTVTIP